MATAVPAGEKIRHVPAPEDRGNIRPSRYGGMRIALVHGNDRELLEKLAGCTSIDLLVCGLTHRPEVRMRGSLLIVNPVGVYGQLNGRSTVARVDTVKRSTEIVDI